MDKKDPVDVFEAEGVEDSRSTVEQLTLFSVKDKAEDIYRGFPEYEQRDLRPWRTVTVSIRSEADYLAFKKAIGADKLRMTGGLNSHNFWYPPNEPQNWSAKEWSSEIPETPSVTPEAEDLDPSGVVIDVEEGLLDLRPSDSLGPFLERVARYKPTINTERLATLAKGQIKEEIVSPLEARWYESLEESRPDYGIYNDDLYIAEAWHCWASYSRKYLRFIRANKESLFSDVRRVVDLGCGFGYTTRALKEIFPEAEVVGTQLEGTLQHEVATGLGRDHGFTVAGSIRDIGAADLIFASEYFEHIEAPIAHLLDVLHETRPRRLVIANAFGTRAAGHFLEYLPRPYTTYFGLSGKQVAKLFRETLRRRGYEPTETTAWNNRPRLWELRGTVE